MKLTILAQGPVGMRGQALGCPVALATDFNPGSSPTQSMFLVLNMACVRFAMSIADYSRGSPTIDPSAFPGTPSAVFWSASVRSAVMASSGPL